MGGGGRGRGTKTVNAHYLARIVVIDVLVSRYLATILKSRVFPLNYKKNIDHHYAKIIPRLATFHNLLHSHWSLPLITSASLLKVEKNERKKEMSK
jgi:hypothetical protein